MTLFKRIKLMLKRRAWEHTVIYCIALQMAYAERWNREYQSPEVREKSYRFVIDAVNDNLEMLGGLYPDYAKEIERARYNAKKSL